MNYSHISLLMVLAGTTTCAGLALGHYFPWRRFFGYQPHALVNYVWGVMWTLGPASVVAVLVSASYINPIIIVWLLFVVGGASTVVFYLIDHRCDIQSALREAIDEVDLLHRQRQGRDDDHETE